MRRRIRNGTSRTLAETKTQCNLFRSEDVLSIFTKKNNSNKLRNSPTDSLGRCRPRKSREAEPIIPPLHSAQIDAGPERPRPGTQNSPEAAVATSPRTNEKMLTGLAVTVKSTWGKGVRYKLDMC